LPTSNIGGTGGVAGYTTINGITFGYAKGGEGGSGGATGGSGNTSNGAEPGTIVNGGGGNYGGGGGFGEGNTSTILYGGDGAVRIIWPGITRAYPSTGTADQFF
jgi:hypothetical protein